MTAWEPIQTARGGSRSPDWRQPFHGFETDPNLSIVALVANHTMDVRCAALLWAAAVHRASLIVAAGPQRAGKTTLLGAYRDLLPADTQLAYVRGRQERFEWANEFDPKRAYLLVNELSNHTNFYVWLPAAKRLFELVAGGVRVGATLHADTAEEVLEYFAQSELGPGVKEVLGIHMVANIGVGMQGNEVVRRITALTLIAPYDGNNVATVELALWDEHADEWEHNDDPEALAKAEARFGMNPGTREAGLDARSTTLEAWLKQGITTAAVRQAAQAARL